MVYGDTDSLFVLLEGRSKQEAFAIGAEIAEIATAAHPPPMELELEKVRAARACVRQVRAVSTPCAVSACSECVQ